MKTLTKEFLEEIVAKNQEALTFGEAGEIMKAYQGAEIMEIIAGAFAYGYEKAKEEGVKNV